MNVTFIVGRPSYAESHLQYKTFFCYFSINLLLLDFSELCIVDVYVSV